MVFEVFIHSPDKAYCSGVITTGTARGPQLTGQDPVLESLESFSFREQNHLLELLFRYRLLAFMEFTLGMALKVSDMW